MPPPSAKSFSSSLPDFLTNFVGDSELLCHFGAKKTNASDAADGINSAALTSDGAAPPSNGASCDDEIYFVSKLEAKDKGVDLREMLIKDGFAVEAKWLEEDARMEEERERRNMEMKRQEDEEKRRLEEKRRHEEEEKRMQMEEEKKRREEDEKRKEEENRREEEGRRRKEEEERRRQVETKAVGKKALEEEFGQIQVRFITCIEVRGSTKILEQRPFSTRFS